MSKDIDIAKIDAIFNSQSTSSKVEGDKGIQDTEDNGIDISKIDAIFNANKVEDDATAEQKERLETSFALGNLNRSFMNKQMDEIKSAIPDTTEQEAYDYLTTDAEDGSTDAIRGTALADRIKSGYGIAKGDAEDREFVQTKYTLADELVATLPLADPINSTDVMVGAKRMPRGQAERVMAQVVENTMHPDLLKSNEAYRNNFFMENYGTTAEKYLIDLDKKLAKLQASLDKEIKRDMDAMPSLMRGGVAGGVDPRAVQSFVESESYGGNTIRNAREKIQSILNNNFASGFDEGFDALSALSLGINDIMAGVSINNILSKSAAGKPLTKRESVALEAYDISEELEGLQNIIAPPSWGNKVGQGLGTTAEMAMPFIPAMSIAGSVGKLASLPIRASAKLTRTAFNKGVVNGVTTGMKRAASLAGKSLHNVGVSTLSGLVVAPLMPSTWSTFVDNRNNRFEIKDGKVVAHDRSVWKDLANAWIESAGEIGGERIGIRMDELIKGSASSLGRVLAIDNLSSKAGKILFGGKTPAYIKSLQQKAGFTGYLSEPLSEVWGDAVVNLMKMGLTGDDNFAEMGNADYWTTTLATCALYGTGLKMATEGLPMTKRIADIERMGRYRKNALNGIESESLYNTMVSILAEEDIEAAAKRLSEIEWNKYHRIDIGHAMDAIRAHYAQSVALSSETETARLNSFMGQVGDIANITYRGKEGNENTNEVVTITDKNGVKYMAISGDSTTPFYVCLDANLERINILSSDVVDVSRTTLEERMATAYSEQFSTEIEIERQQQLIDHYNEVRAGVGGVDAINRVRTLFGAEEYHSGDDVTLADGTQAIVEEYLPETGEYVVTKVDGTMECVPFYNILSTNAFTAEAQSLSFAQRALSTAENEIDIEEDVENSIETEQITESDATENGALAVGDVVITPTGERVRIRAINENGSYEVDYNTAERVSPEDMEIEVFAEADLKAESAEVAPAQDVLTDVDTPPISEGIEETVGEEASPVAPQIENKPIPTNEDGTINYEAIEDPKQFVDLYSHEAGGIDTAITDVKEMRDSAVAEVAKNAEQGKKITSPNEKIANRKKQETLAQKVAFYDSVLAELEQRVKPTEGAENATPVEDVVLGTEDVVEAEAAEDITDDATTSETKIEEAQPKEVGLVDNELSKDLRKPIYKTLNALGEALGIQIELVDAIDGVKANGQIIGNRIQIAWKDRMKAVTFVAGHEFLHRLKDIAPEQYEKFKESVKNDLGEGGFAARINRMRRNYEYTNEQRIKKGQKPLAYTDTLLEEEVIADRMGEYVENAEAFNHYLESIKPQNALLRAIRDAWAYIKNLFKGAEYRAETKRINDMLEAIDALIDAGASAIKKAQDTERLGESNAVQGKERHSIIAPTFYSNAQYAVQSIKQEKATPEQWLKMIEKNGGLKAGEDKWLGLSDWLKASDKKTLTKDEVLQYIAENDIQIEEVSYGDVADISREEIYESAEFAELREGLTEYDENGNPYINRERYDELRSESYDFVDGFSLDYWGEDLMVDSPAAAATYLGFTKTDKKINDTRLIYTTRGLSNKQEIALTVPTIEPYNQSDEIHFGDAGEGRAVAWIRFGEATDADGKRVLVIDEIQSKRHQEGREKGYSDKRVSQQELYDAQEEAFSKVIDYESALADKYGEDEWASLASEEEMAEYERLRAIDEAATNAYENYDKGIPSAPFEKNWAELAFKRMLRYAAENGYDYVAWTTGDQQADRYNLAKMYNYIEREDNPSIKGKRFVLAGGNHDNFVVDDNAIVVSSSISEANGKSLTDVVGKDMAEKMMSLEDGDTISGDGLRIGGEGMRGFYDQMLPSFVKKYTKKWGAEVGEVTMPDLAENSTMHAVNVTDSMRESVMQGQPKFSLAALEEDLQNENISIDNEAILDAYGLSSLTISKKGNYVTLSKIVVDDREKGNGTRFMNDLVRLADNNGWILALTPDTSFGATSVKRLKGFYKRFGFNENKGRNTDFSTRERMVRKPQNEAKYSLVTEHIENLFNDAVAGKLDGKPITIGTLTSEGKKYLEEISGLKLRDRVSFTLNPSDLVHIHNDHFEDNEKDKGNNIPLTTLDIKRIVDVISFPTAILYGKEKNSGRNLFYFLMDSGYGAYNLLEVYSDRKGNLSTKTYYKTKKDAAQRVMELKKSLLPTSETYSGAILSDTKIPQIFELPKIEARNSLIIPEMDATYLDAVERGDMATAQKMVMEAAKLAMPNTKVVDEDGNPKVVYHGTGGKFYTFRKTSDINELGAGYYFSDSYEMAERYATDETLADNRFRVEALAFDIFTDEMGHSEEDYDDIEFEDDYNESYALAVERLFGNGRVMSVFLNIEKPRILSRVSPDFDPVYQYGFNYYNEGVMAKRYNDGVIDEMFTERHNSLTGNQYVAFSPNQIKSADPVTYDDNGNVIPLAERFNPEKEDIRYSMQTINALTDALAEYNANGDITSFVDSVRAENERFGGHQYLTNLIMDYEEDGDAEWFAEKIKGVIGEANEDYAPYTTEGVKYSLSEETAQIFDAAKAKFGTTYDMREAGYILPDGSMLDFSGRHQVEGDASFLNGDRTVDHREISDVAYDADDNETGIKTDLGDFLDRGAIRIDYNAGAINLNVAPTKAQKDRLKRLIERNEGYVYVDFGKGWDTEHYAEYEAARASRVLGDIDRYFDEGIKPTGNVRLSLQSVIFNEYANEIDLLNDEYSKIDSADIGPKHPYRIHKREVIQRYADHIAGVLNLPCEAFAVDIEDDNQIKDAYYKYMKSHKEWAAQHNTTPDYIPKDKFIAMVKPGGAAAAYIPETTLTLLFISETDGYDTSAKWVETLFHENTHKVIETLGISDFEKESVYNEAKKINPKAVAKIDNGYTNATIAERGEEIIAYAIEARLRAGEVLFDYLEGKKGIQDILDTYKLNVPLRNQVIRKVLNTLKDGYERKQGKSTGGSRVENKSDDVRFRSKLADQREYYTSLRGGDKRNRAEVDARYSIQTPEGAIADPRATEETVRTYMKRGHQVTKANIRKRYKAYRDVVCQEYSGLG